MSSVQSTVSDMTVTVKSREVQRGMLAEMGSKHEEAREHFLAAAHLELVLSTITSRLPRWISRAAAVSARLLASGGPVMLRGLALSLKKKDGPTQADRMRSRS